MTYNKQVSYFTSSKKSEWAYWTVGEGPTIILLHGLASSMASWFPLIQKLSRNYRCIMVDLPGFGLSKAADRPLNLMSYTDELKELVDALNIESFSILGHSMGGQIGLMYAVRYAEGLEKLYLVSPAGMESFSATELAMIKPSLKGISYALESSGIIEPFFHGLNVNNNDLFNQFLFQMSPVIKENVGAFADSLFEGSVAMLEAPVMDHLAQINIPCHVFFGSQDPMIPNKMMHPFLSLKKIKKDADALNPAITWDFIDSCGHFPQLEQLEDLRTLLVSRGLNC